MIDHHSLDFNYILKTIRKILTVDKTTNLQKRYLYPPQFYDLNSFHIFLRHSEQLLLLHYINIVLTIINGIFSDPRTKI